MSQFRPNDVQYILYAAKLLKAIKQATSFKDLRLLYPSLYRFTVSTSKYAEIPDLKAEVLHSYRERYILAYVRTSNHR